MENGSKIILKSIDEICENGFRKKFSDEFCKSVSQQGKVVDNYLGINNDRLSIWWSIFFNLTINHTSVSLEDISNFLHVSVVKVMSFVSEFDSLVGLKLLRRERSNSRRRKRPDRLNSFNHFVPADIIHALMRNEASLPARTKSNLNKYQILDIIYNLIVNDMDNDLLNFQGLCDEIELIFEENPDSTFLNQVKGFHLQIEDQIILFTTCCEFTDNESVDLTRLLKILYPDVETQILIRKQFLKSESKLQKLDLVDLKPDNFRNDREVQLTENGKKVFFSDDIEFFMKQDITCQKDLILHDSIPEKTLFYNEEERKNLEFLTNLLKPENKVLEKMRDLRIRPQVMVLVNGGPGVGKTEFVYQVARQTGRNIKRIELSDTKSHFYGDSEKLTTKIFRDFSLLRKSSEIEPILFINEIDGWLGQRSVGGSSAVDQTENSIQSILLQQLEEFEGILFGCTNIWKRLDSSYMRRFGFKYEITPPDESTRFLLWKDKLPTLTDEQAKYLSERHLLTGGTIDNICRKVILCQLINNSIPNLLEIDEFCQQEFLEKPMEKRRIGYLS